MLKKIGLPVVMLLAALAVQTPPASAQDRDDYHANYGNEHRVSRDRRDARADSEQMEQVRPRDPREGAEHQRDRDWRRDRDDAGYPYDRR